MVNANILVFYKKHPQFSNDKNTCETIPIQRYKYKAED